MEQASQAASRALSSERREPQAADSELPPLVAWLWQQLVAMYGSAVLTAYGVDDKPPKIWIGALSRLTGGEAKAGIAALAKQGRSYPPNLTEVLEACRPKKLVRYAGGPSSMYRRGLPPPRAREEHVAKCLGAMRKALAYSGDNEPVPHSEREKWNTRACTCGAKGECDTCRWFAGVREDVHGRRA